MGIVQEVANSSAMGVGEVVKGAVALASAGTIAVKSLVKVPKYHRGIPTVRENPERTWGRRKGERYKAVGSGLHLVPPFVGSIESISTQEQSRDLPAFNVLCQDGKFIVDATVVWYVKQNQRVGAQDSISETEDHAPRLSRREYLQATAYGVSDRVWSWYFSEGRSKLPKEVSAISEDDKNLYNALFKKERENLDRYIQSLARAGIVAAAPTMTSRALLQPNVTLPETYKLHGEALDQHGVAIDSIFVTSFAPSEAQVVVDGARELLGGDPSGIGNVVMGSFGQIRAIADE